MVSALDEFLEAKKIISGVARSLGIGGKKLPMVPLGVLLEVPAAVMIVESLADEADFFSLGTNDLIQYTLATGRLNEEVSYLYNPLHPAVLSLLKSVAGVAAERGKETIVCGEVASDLMYSQVLVGLGFDSLSVAPLAIPRLKETLRDTSARELEEGVSEMLKLSRPGEIKKFVEKRFKLKR